MLDNGTNTVMSSRATFAYQFDSTGIEVDIIMQHEQMFQWDFEIIDKAPHTLTGPIHIGLGLNQINLVIVGPTLAKCALHFQGISLPAVYVGQMIEEKKPDIMSGLMIFLPRVTQANEQKSRIRHGGNKCDKRNEPKINFGSDSITHGEGRIYFQLKEPLQSRNSYTDCFRLFQHFNVFRNDEIAIAQSCTTLLQWSNINLDDIGNIQGATA